MRKPHYTVKVSYPATSKVLSISGNSAIAVALSAGFQCRGGLTRPTGYLVVKDGVSQLALTEAEMQGLRNRQIVYTHSLQRKEAHSGHK